MQLSITKIIRTISAIFQSLVGLIFPVDPKDAEIETLLKNQTVEQISAMIPHAPMPLRGIVSPEQANGTYNVHAVWKYRSPLAHALIWRLKYARDRRAADCAGYAPAEYIEKSMKKSIVENADHLILIPIPLSKKRRRERGYNQSEWICEAILKHLKNAKTAHDRSFDISIRTDILLRVEHRERQTFKDRSSRIKNTEDIFTIQNIPNTASDPEHQTTFLIIDDVVTTGSTFLAAQQTFFKANPTLRIMCLAVCH